MNCVIAAGYPDSLIAFRGDLISNIQSFGFTVHVVVPKVDDTTLLDQFNRMGLVVHMVPLSRTGMSIVGDLRYFLAVLRSIKLIRPSIFLAYTVKPVVYGLLAGRLCSIERRFALITGLGYAFGGRSRIAHALVKILYRLALKGATLTFFQNPDDERHFRDQRLLGPHAKSMVVPGSGVNLDKFRFLAGPKPPPVFLMIARLLGAKGVREYAEAARHVRAATPAARFRLAGWIDDNPDAIAQSELDQWVADGVIEYLGRLDDVRTALAEASVYVLPSYREGTPRTVLEAMAIGRAIITTDTPGCRETVVNGENGFLVPAKSVMPLALAMQQFIDDPALASLMGGRSRQLAEMKFDVRKVNEMMLRGMRVIHDDSALEVR